MSRGAIDFIKPAKNGSYRREEFEITDAEVVALKKQLSGVAAEILDLSFLQKGCAKKDCEWCRLGVNLTGLRSQYTVSNG